MCSPDSLVASVLSKIMSDSKLSAEQINHGHCFDFADILQDTYPDIFQSIGIGDIMRYENDESIGYDEDLLAKYWSGYKPYGSLSWNQMFRDVGLHWPGTHAWGYCHLNKLCYDAETPRGVSNPFMLKFFEPYFTQFELEKVLTL